MFCTIFWCQHKDHGLPIYSLDYLTQKVQTLMKCSVIHAKEGCHQQTCCSYNLAPSHKTIPGMNLEFFMTPQGEISWQYKNIWFLSYNTYIFCQANCLVHHCDSIYRMPFIIKCWLFSSCMLYVCSFPINTHFSLWAVHIVHLTYQIWNWFSW